MELHVLYVPDDHWDVKLNKVPAEAIERFISAGFIRCVSKCQKVPDYASEGLGDVVVTVLSIEIHDEVLLRKVAVSPCGVQKMTENCFNYY